MPIITQAQKLRYYCDLSEQTASNVITKRGNWMNFLNSVASMYKYSFSDQLLIHAQSPDATACAPKYGILLLSGGCNLE